MNGAPQTRKQHRRIVAITEAEKGEDLIRNLAGRRPGMGISCMRRRGEQGVTTS